MKRLLLTTALVFACAGLAPAQTAMDSNEGTRLIFDSSNTLQPYSFKFWGRSGYLYYVEKTEDLTTTWDYLELGILGNDAAENIDFNSTSSTLFMRLVFTNDPSDPLFTGSFDNDSISNYDQILMGMNPFFDEGVLNLAGDEDSDGVLNEFDAAPYRASVGALSVSITSPTSGATIN